MATFLMTLALADGASKFFWRQAIRGDVPLADLHYHWKAATGALSALTTLKQRRAIRVSVVTLLMAATNLLRGPMMQRALSVRTVDLTPKGDLELGVLPTTRVWDLEPPEGYDWKRPLWDVVREYRAKTPMRIPGAESCNNCTVDVELMGFDYSTSTSKKFSYNLSERPMKNATRRDEDIFKIESFANADYVTISVTRKMDEDCETHLITTEHYLYPASVKHKLLLDGGNATFVSKSWSDDYVAERRYVFILSSIVVFELTSRRKLGFSSANTMNNRLNYFRIMVDKLFAARTTLTVAWGDVQLDTTLEQGTYFDPIFTEHENPKDPKTKVQYRVHSDGLLSDLYQQGRSVKCGQAFQDPMDDILNTYRELTLRLAIWDARNRSDAAISAGDKTGKSNFFQAVKYTRPEQIQAEYTANRTNLAVAVFVSLLGPLATLVLFWGFWELGRDFSMSPLELANAFLAGSAPRKATAETDSDTNRPVTITESEVTPNRNQLATILAGCSSNASADDIVSHILKIWKNSQEPAVQYGVLASNNRLGFAVVRSEGVDRLPKSETWSVD
ncbi:unnamed protein product [Sordaria macrospora k-hell]|uniref:WGS project CABT00000000 data, contig 2.33 n=2 Tax=Sordaria macrospora TaxID=5147 RepID=F7W658_SORMK|nr:uncharacterized protein SMAC_06139 [Sordaria macrospora k-hell]KAH7630337.1 hypothetical protein B0T09DRAFT_400241 [Sordaria sp. MPI-SDFR-AT-0083]CCC12996.1 unnamed protein product [Sordaria macrospora k-hell]